MRSIGLRGSYSNSNSIKHGIRVGVIWPPTVGAENLAVLREIMTEVKNFATPGT